MERNMEKIMAGCSRICKRPPKTSKN